MIEIFYKFNLPNLLYIKIGKKIIFLLFFE